MMRYAVPMDYSSWGDNVSTIVILAIAQALFLEF